MVTVFLDGKKGIFPLNILPRVATVNCDRNTEILEILNASLRPSRKMSYFTTLYGNASSCTRVHASEAIRLFG